jgi:hypothetical protein
MEGRARALEDNTCQICLHQQRCHATSDIFHNCSQEVPDLFELCERRLWSTTEVGVAQNHTQELRKFPLLK